MSLSEAVSNVITSGPTDVMGKDVGVFADIKQYFVDFKTTMINNNYAFDVFEKNLLFLKAFGLIIIIIMASVSYYNYKDVGLIKKQPYVFICESVIFALAGVAPFLMLCYLRNQHYTYSQIAMMSIVIFMVMFILNYLLEISGFYAWSFDTIDPDDKNKRFNDDPSSSEKLKKTVSSTSDIIVIGMIVGSFIALIFSSIFVMNTSPDYVHLTSLPTGLLFFLEMFVFGIISAVPIFVVSYNRKKYENNKQNQKKIDPPVFTKTTIIEFFVIVAKFALLHCLLQISGLYSKIFHKQ